MANFIKLHHRDNGDPVLVNLDNITCVSLHNGATCLFEVGNSRNPFVVLETIDEIMEIVSGTNISNDRRDLVSKLFDRGRITMNEARRLLELEPWGPAGNLKVPQKDEAAIRSVWGSDIIEKIDKALNDDGGNNSV